MRLYNQLIIGFVMIHRKAVLLHRKHNESSPFYYTVIKITSVGVKNVGMRATQYSKLAGLLCLNRWWGR